ncbi:MAG: DUF1080 domain-containing protein [Candidatus Limimorpha sp.]
MNKLRNIFRFLCLTAAASFILVACVDVKEESGGRKAEETFDSYRTLFDGESLAGWRARGGEMAPSVWTVEDGCLKSKADASAEDCDIIFDERFKNFELVFEWKTKEDAKAGVFYLGKEIENIPLMLSALEYQIVGDDKTVSDDKMRNASLSGIIASNHQDANNVAEWNTGKILCYKGTVIHYINGKMALQYNLWTPQWTETLHSSGISDERFDCMDNCGGEDRDGYIGLHYQGGEVWFRNIKIKDLN